MRIEINISKIDLICYILTYHLYGGSVEVRSESSQLYRIKEDFRIFWKKRPGNFLKLLYFPDIRTEVIFRLSQFFFNIGLKPIAYLLTNLNDLLHGIWIGPRVEVGEGFSLGHPRGLVVSPATKIGRYVTIINQVTLGGPSVVIEDFVEIGAGVQIISTQTRPVTVGAHSIIGAGSVLVHSVPPFSVVVGVPARVVKLKNLSSWLEEHPYYIDNV